MTSKPEPNYEGIRDYTSLGERGNVYNKLIELLHSYYPEGTIDTAEMRGYEFLGWHTYIYIPDNPVYSPLLIRIGRDSSIHLNVLGYGSDTPNAISYINDFNIAKERDELKEKERRTAAIDLDLNGEVLSDKLKAALLDAVTETDYGGSLSIGRELNGLRYSLYTTTGQFDCMVISRGDEIISNGPFIPYSAHISIAEYLEAANLDETQIDLQYKQRVLSDHSPF